MSINLCDFVEYEGRKINKQVFRQKVLCGEIVLGQSKEERVVNNILKITNALANPKAKSLFDKFYKSNPDKFYQELLNFGATKQQIDILKEWNKNHNPLDEIDMLLGMMSEMSYTVEINTAKAPTYDYVLLGEGQSGTIPYEDSQYERSYSYQTGEASYKKYDNYGRNGVVITKEEFDKVNKEYNKGIPTQHYSHMTAPGGTNYTENEIATPGIVPSIKGHAQFSSEHGIGWFRSDDAVITGKESTVSQHDFDMAQQSISQAKRLLSRGEISEQEYQNTLDKLSNYGVHDNKRTYSNIDLAIDDLKKSGRLKVIC